MATRVFKAKADDPRFQLRKAVRLMRKTLDTLAKAADRAEVKSADGGLIQAGGLQPKEVDSLVSVTRTLHALARQADADDVARFRQLKGMTDEQLEEQERRLKSAMHSEAIKEGLRAKALSREVPLENEDGDDPEE